MHAKVAPDPRSLAEDDAVWRSYDSEFNVGAHAAAAESNLDVVPRIDHGGSNGELTALSGVWHGQDNEHPEEEEAEGARLVQKLQDQSLVATSATSTRASLFAAMGQTTRNIKDALGRAAKSFRASRASGQTPPTASSNKLNMSWYALRWEYSREEAGGLRDSEDSSFASRFSIPVLHDRKMFVYCWDLMMLVFITYTAIVTPYESGFILLWQWGTRHIVSVFMDGMFLLDTVLQFNISYYSVRRQVTVLSRNKITAKYLRGDFAIDLISIIPLDIIVWSIACRGVTDCSGNLWLRVVVLVKMLRLSRLRRIVTRVEASTPINYGVWTVLNFLIMTVLISHWVACLWGLIAEIEIEQNIQDPQCWMADVATSYGLDYENGQFFKPANDQDSMVDTEPNFFLYTMALYFAVYSLASVGYGDAVPVTDLERYFACAAMLLGSYFLGYIVASITSVVATRNADSSDYYRLMDQLNKFMDEHVLERELRLRLRNYFHYRKQTRGMQSWNTIINQMSPSLRKEVFAHTSCQLIKDVEFFKNCDEEGGFIMDLGMCLETNTYTPKEKIINIDDEAHNMYIVRRGVVASEGRIFMRQGVFGTDMLEGLLRDTRPMRNYMAIALTYSDVLLISGTSLQRVMSIYPDAEHIIKSRILRKILKHEVKAYTAAMTRILTGRRPYWTRLRGDPGGREIHYYNKLVQLVPQDENHAAFLRIILAASTIQRAVRSYLKLKKIKTVWKMGAAKHQDMLQRSQSTKSLRSMTRQSMTSSSVVVRATADGSSGSGGIVESAGLMDSETLDSWKGVLQNLQDLKNKVQGVKAVQNAQLGMRRSTAIM